MKVEQCQCPLYMEQPSSARRVEAGGGGGGCGEAPKTPAAMIAPGSRSSSSLIRDVGFIICILNRWRAVVEGVFV